MVKFFKTNNKYYVSKAFPALVAIIRTCNGMYAFDNYFESQYFMLTNVGCERIHINGKC